MENWEEKTMQPKWYIVLILAAALVGMSSVAEDAANNSTECVGCNSSSANVTEEQLEMFIFIQEGSGGSFVNDGSGNYTLTITDVIPYTVFFADRPSRDVGFVPNDEFLEGFSFGTGNPANAAIILPDENETSDMVVVRLSEPHYNNETGTLTYNAELLKDYLFESGWLQDQISKVDASIPERFGKVILVIDDCPCLPHHYCESNNVGYGCHNSCWDLDKFRCTICGGCCNSGFFC
jgi:hypothetical protein